MTQEKLDLAQIIISGSVSLVAAFAGAYFAFKFQAASKEKETVAANITGALDGMFTLLRMLNRVGAYRNQIVNPVRDQRLRFFSMPPTHEVTEEINFSWASLTFLMGTPHANVLADISLAHTKFQTLVSAIVQRNSIMLEHVQPRAAAAGLRQGELAVTEASIEGLIGHRIYASLERLTDDIIEFTDASYLELSQNIDNLRTSILNIYPHAVLPKFEIE